MGIKKRIIAWASALAVSISALSVTAYAENYVWVPVKEVRLSGADMSYNCQLKGSRYFDRRSWSDDFWCKPIAYVRGSCNYYIQGLYSDGFFSDSVSTQLRIQDIYTNYKHQAVIASGGKRNHSDVYKGVRKSGSLDDSGTVTLKEDSASFRGIVSTDNIFY